MREECLNPHAFVCLDDARKRIETWRTDYNTVRPQSALGNWRRGNSDDCITRKAARSPAYKWCTRRCKVSAGCLRAQAPDHAQCNGQNQNAL
ncbi:transposase [Burkholderia sp. Ac-20345]|nr:transposase [Burkholderia sp. Ac-20345]